MSMIANLLRDAVSRDASDLHLKTGQTPFLRIHGRLTASGGSPLTAEDLWAMIREILPKHLAESFEKSHEADFSYALDGVGRFRVNAFMAQLNPALVMRHVKTTIPTIEELHLPAALKTLALTPRGIVVLSGTTGCGKSTTLAALIQQINRSQARRIITVEDPIEYLFADGQSLITQREVGLDTMSFHQALKHVLRQDPDVIMIGEMRDKESFQTALAAAETGHLIMTTLHAGTAAAATHRVLEFFPSGEWEQTRLALAANLHAVVCQRLIPASQGGVVPAVEILINSPTVRKLIEQDKLDLLPAAIETGVEDGMQTFNQSIYKLITEGYITQEEGMRHATNPAALRMNLQGIFLDESRRILSV